MAKRDRFRHEPAPRAQSLVLSPPLTITRAESDAVVELARQSLDETADAIVRGG